MSKVICEYCGTEYADHMQRCPLCGSLNESVNFGPEAVEEAELVTAPPRRRPAQTQTPRGRTPPSYIPPDDEDEDDDEDDEDDGRRRSRRPRAGKRQGRRDDAIPRWISVLICVILGLAVIIGALFALYSLGILSPKEKSSAKEDSSLTLPLDQDKTDDPEQTPDTGKVEQPTQTPDEPADVPVVTEPEITPEPENVTCTSISLDRADVSLLGKGESFVLSASLSPSNCTDKLVWSSEKPEISKVDQTGRVTAVNGGTTNIIATCGSVTATCIVRNNFPFDASLSDDGDAETGDTPQTGGSASLSLTDFTLFKVGETAKITVNNAGGSAVTWSSSDTSVATVDGGTVKAVKSGTATVTAEVGGQKLKCTVRCNLKGAVDANDQNAENADGGSAALSHEDVTLSKGESFKLSVTGGSGGGWSVSDSAVCSVDANGNVKGLASGTATVSTTVGGQKLKCTVRVK